MSLFPRKERPPFVREYLDQTPKRLPGKTPAEAIRFVALDTEASGFHVDNDRILSVAVMELKAGAIDVASAREWIVNQPQTLPNKASEIHGILRSEIEQGVPAPAMLEELLPMLSGAVVVGHNIRFDAFMLDAACQRHFGIRFRNALVDCGAMAMNELVPFHRVGYARQRMPTIEDICAHLDLPMPDRHTAEGDAFIAAQLFLLLTARMRRRTGRPLRLRDFPLSRIS
ncbi:exonuclease domain-containing protein [Pontiella sp.]|uniref:3'-5' exonuclease n=1 Tax=Pontiella sp. TaxID=2837462 RepID=UPI0035676140